LKLFDKVITRFCIIDSFSMNSPRALRVQLQKTPENVQFISATTEKGINLKDRTFTYHKLNQIRHFVFRVNHMGMNSVAAV